MKCDSCITGEARHRESFSLLAEPGKRIAATLDLCAICYACMQHVSDAILRKGQEWKVPVVKPAPESPTLTQAEMARVYGYTGDVCKGCGQFTMRRTGPCLTCQVCGFNEGCT